MKNKSSQYITDWSKSLKAVLNRSKRVAKNFPNALSSAGPVLHVPRRKRDEDSFHHH